MPTTVTLQGVVKRFPGAAAPAVDGVSLEIRPGELFCIVGPSGCGKTTLLRVIAGFVEPNQGRVSFDGRDVTGLPPERRDTGMVFQSYALWPHMTAEANVAFGLSVRRVTRDEQARRVAEALASVRMNHYAARKPNQLSGGQQQRVALARALVVRPSVLLLDEPLSNLDARLRVELRAEIRRVCKDAGITTIYVTHDQKEALSMADRLAVLDRGRVIQNGAPIDLYRRPASRFVAEFLGQTNLIPARLLPEQGPGAQVQTPMGTLKTSAAPPQGAADLLCSIRPESFRLAADGDLNRLHGCVVESTYLGESAQLAVRTADGAVLRAVILNPGREDLTPRPIILAVSPDDVALLPASAPEP
jgi:iron(III) transport system ATP-binding protein